MKTIIIILLCCLSVSAQIKCKLSKDEVDNGKIKRTTDYMTIGKLDGGVKLKAGVARTDHTYAILLTLNDDLGCLTKDAKCTLRFQDGDSLTLHYTGKIDCKEGLRYFFSPISDHLDRINSKEITGIHYALQSSRDLQVTKPQFLKELLVCVNSK